ncbi:hypothetical protein [Nitrosopumilus maritimus]|uniref:Uncharacterized protein n=1 Tax=Nitrosopumilus maritimus (strain SCM1) TaxID=436308 RepID=A9A416_NITMS|nr:hypothetical protein [Nitrosopumilus maritimus]ABX12200.1 hypothetical protein Nmar_0304 [Nitrosopumilus maritimus SCM1]
MVEDYKSFLEVLMVSNKNIRFSAMCNLKGELLFQKRRDDIRELFSLEETKEQLSRTIESWKSRVEIKDKVGRPLYSVTSYEKIKRMTIPIDEEHLLFISIDNKEEEVEMFKNINIKNISSLLDIGPTKS